MDVIFVVLLGVAIVVGLIWLGNRLLGAPPTKMSDYREVPHREPPVSPVNTFVPPAKHIHLYEDIVYANGQPKLRKCAGCGYTIDA